MIYFRLSSTSPEAELLAGNIRAAADAAGHTVVIDVVHAENDAMLFSDAAKVRAAEELTRNMLVKIGAAPHNTA